MLVNQTKHITTKHITTKHNMTKHITTKHNIKHIAMRGGPLLLTAACTALLPTGTFAQVQEDASATASVDFLYASRQGSDSFSGQSPTVSAGSGPFQTLAHTQEAVNVLTEAGLSRPLEVVLDSGVCPTQDFLLRWFPSLPSGPVIWHSDPSRTVLIYTPSMTEQVEALGAEDYTVAPGGERVARFYVAADGSDAWSGLLPGPDSTGKSDGPFRTLSCAQEAVNALRTENPHAAVEVVLEAGAFAPSVNALRAGTAHFDAAKAGGKAVKAGGKAAKPSKYTAAGLAALKALKAAGKSSAANIKTVYAKGGPVRIGVPLAGATLSPHLVFAHYMLCAASYGPSVAGYERDIQDAQAAGLDGFALNLGDWEGTGYQNNTEMIFQAAEALHSGFKLFFSADMTGLKFQQIPPMMTAYANRPNYWHIQQATGSTIVSRAVLSTWGGEGGTYTNVRGWWQNLVLKPLKDVGIDVYFMPLFFITAPDGSYVNYSPTNNSTQIQGLLNGVADGEFNANSIGQPVDPARTMLSTAEAYAAQLKAAGYGTMSSITPQYWQCRNVSWGREYVEYDGGEGLAAQWNSIINTQKPDWVEMFTWNDFNEATYFSPVDDVNKYWPYSGNPAPGFYKCHAGMLKLNQYYVNWYKSGIKPAVTSDSLYYFYRTHPKDAVATNDTFPAVGYFVGTCTDTIFVTSILTSPATLVVTSGSQTTTYPVPAGVSHTRIPFQVGAQSFRLIRNSHTVLSQTGQPIIASPAQYDFYYNTGYITNQSGS